MAIFNFKVRAKDNLGAFADRNFSIGVRNTVVNKFVASTDEGIILTSINGHDWTASGPTALSGNKRFGDVMWGGSYWLITLSSTQYLRSDDAKIWEIRDFPGFFLNTDNIPPLSPRFGFGDGKIAIVARDSVATDHTYLWTTENGIDWVKSTEPLLISSSNITIARLNRPFFADNRWYVTTLGPAQTTCCTYTNRAGTDPWTNVAIPNASLGGIVNMFYKNGLYFIVGSTGVYAISPDLVNWNYMSNPTTITNLSVSCVLYGNGSLVSYADQIGAGTSDWNKIYKSVNARTWTSTVVPPLAHALMSGGSSFYSYGTNSDYEGRITGTYYGGVYLFGSRTVRNSSNNGGLLYSNDGTTWEQLKIPRVSGTATTFVTINGLASMGQNAG